MKKPKKRSKTLSISQEALVWPEARLRLGIILVLTMEQSTIQPYSWMERNQPMITVFSSFPSSLWLMTFSRITSTGANMNMNLPDIFIWENLKSLQVWITLLCHQLVLIWYQWKRAAAAVQTIWFRAKTHSEKVHNIRTGKCISNHSLLYLTNLSLRITLTVTIWIKEWITVRTLIKSHLAILKVHSVTGKQEESMMDEKIISIRCWLNKRNN